MLASFDLAFFDSILEVGAGALELALSIGYDILTVARLRTNLERVSLNLSNRLRLPDYSERTSLTRVLHRHIPFDKGICVGT
jgi:hypothetical protein